eukprot:c6683_g1_i1 orf=48-233(-)
MYHFLTSWKPKQTNIVCTSSLIISPLHHRQSLASLANGGFSHFTCLLLIFWNPIFSLAIQA